MPRYQPVLFSEGSDYELPTESYSRLQGLGLTFPDFLDRYFVPWERTHRERIWGDWCPWDCALCNDLNPVPFNPRLVTRG
jgi:hypothetical protein